MAEENSPLGLDAPANSQDPSESGPDVFAADMWEGTSSGDEESRESGSDQAGGRASSQPTFDPSRVNATSTKVEDVPEPMRPLFESMQEQFKGLQRTLAERDEQIKSLQTGQPQAPAQPGQNGQAQRTQAQPQTQRDPLNPYPYLLDGINDPETRQIVTAGAQQVQAIIQHEYGDQLQMLQIVPTLISVVSQLAGHTTAQQQEAQKSEERLAVDAFGAGAVERAKNEGLVTTLQQKVNPATGKNFTFTEAYERLYGITAEQQENIRQNREAARKQAKRSAGPAPAASSGTGQRTTGISMEEARSRMRDAGFE